MSIDEDDDGEVVATIGGEMPVGNFDGAGSGFGLTSCRRCGRTIDTTCSVCPTSTGGRVSREDALKRHAELHEQSRREHGYYKRGAR